MGGTYIVLDVELSWTNISQNLSINLLMVHFWRISMKTSSVLQEEVGGMGWRESELVTANDH